MATDTKVKRVRAETVAAEGRAELTFTGSGKPQVRIANTFPPIGGMTRERFNLILENREGIESLLEQGEGMGKEREIAALKAKLAQLED